MENKVYILSNEMTSRENPVRKYRRLIQVGKGWDTTVRWFKGEPLKSIWKPLTVKYSLADVNLEIPDSPLFLPPVQILNRRAVDAIGSFLEKFGELLALQCTTDELYLYNVTNVLPNILDEAHSTIVYHKDTHEIIDIEKFVFHPQMLEKNPVFKIDQDNATSIFVTELCRRLILDQKLTGVGFSEELTN